MMRKKKMISKIKYNYAEKGRGADIEMEIDLSRFDIQYGRAQYELDSAIMTSMEKYMPMRDGVFIDVTKAMSASIAGSGTVVAAAPPFGRFLYEGKVMVDPETNSPWARPGTKKEVTNKDLNYNKSNHPEATDHWFDKAKENHLDEWIRNFKRTAGGG